MSIDQVWKIFFYHTNTPKNFSQDFSRMENDPTFFYTFQDSVGTLTIVCCNYTCKLSYFDNEMKHFFCRILTNPIVMS